MKKRLPPYRIEISYSSADGYIARVPELPGCSASGETIYYGGDHRGTDCYGAVVGGSPGRLG